MLTHACAPHTVLQVAVKTTVVDFSKVSEQDAAWVCENAVREAEIVSVLSHPNIITTYSYKLNRGSSMPADCLLDLVPEPAEKRKAPWQLDLVQACGVGAGRNGLLYQYYIIQYVNITSVNLSLYGM